MKKYIVIIFVFLLILLAWSPWQSKESVESAMRDVFESEQTGVIDGCGLNCDGCGIEGSRKIPFGYLVNIKYKCGMKNYFRGEKRLVTSFGISFVVSKY